MAEHNIIGQLGEQLAAKKLQKKGFKIIETNWKVGHLEMDIIAENRKEIVFVEVKTRTTTFGDKRPEQYVDQLKRHRLIAAGNAYIKMHNIEKKPRFDIIGILINPDSNDVTECVHLENAFQPRTHTIGQHTFNGLWKWKHRTKTIQ